MNNPCRIHLWTAVVMAILGGFSGCGPVPAAPAELAVAVASNEGTTSTGRQVEFRFPETAPGGSSEARILLKNLGGEPLMVEAVEWEGRAFAFELGTLSDPFLDGGAQRELPVRFIPPRAGTFVSSLRVRARSSAGEQFASITLVGLSGSIALEPEPDINVLPFPTLDLGRIPWFADAAATSIRKVVVFNVGGAGGLRIESVEVHALGASSLDDEIEVRFPEGWDASSVLDSRAGANALELEVRVTPDSLGLKRWALTIRSNDPDEPQLTVEVFADVIAPSPCHFSVSPEEIAIGLISPPGLVETWWSGSPILGQGRPTTA